MINKLSHLDFIFSVRAGVAQKAGYKSREGSIPFIFEKYLKSAIGAKMDLILMWMRIAAVSPLSQFTTHVRISYCIMHILLTHCSCEDCSCSSVEPFYAHVSVTAGMRITPLSLPVGSAAASWAKVGCWPCPRFHGVCIVLLTSASLPGISCWGPAVQSRSNNISLPWAILERAALLTLTLSATFSWLMSNKKPTVNYLSEEMQSIANQMWALKRKHL